MRGECECGWVRWRHNERGRTLCEGADTAMHTITRWRLPGAAAGLVPVLTTVLGRLVLWDRDDATIRTLTRGIEFRESLIESMRGSLECGRPSAAGG